MKAILLSLTASLIFLGCTEDFLLDRTPPAPPQGILATPLDNGVQLTWIANTEPDVAGYNVWFSDQYDGKYTFLASTTRLELLDGGARNGVRTYYAISAYDFEENESNLSRDVVYATPRPEGYGTRISDYRTLPGAAGYDFSTYSVGRYDDDFTDLFFEHYNGRFYLNVWDDTDLQDMGYTRSLYDIVEAPSGGWTPSKLAEAIPGHTYVIWTWDDNYAKVRVREVSSSRVTFDWAYQVATGNPDLKRQNPDGNQRKVGRRAPLALKK